MIRKSKKERIIWKINHKMSFEIELDRINWITPPLEKSALKEFHQIFYASLEIPASKNLLHILFFEIRALKDILE
ncbi:unnamed protein product [Blepharisma stoltei]|uniref:Uncharacterized protein n=1 Tax=Blepharisma stoltei TaxID=1481888 RepID=A0AAU9K5Z2_9CILI|nr:unnamed protein product [Blepharisma stoltei]